MSINPVSADWLIFGASVALHVCIKLIKLFDLIPNGFENELNGSGDALLNLASSGGLCNIDLPLAAPVAMSFYVNNYCEYL